MKTTPKPRQTGMTEESFFSKLLRIILVLAFDAGAVWFIQNAVSRGFSQLLWVMVVITIMLNVIFLHPKAYPFRWMALGLSFLTLFTIYPMLFTFYVAFTNYGDGHLLTKEQAIPLIEKTTFLSEGGKSYSWTAFKSPEGDYALWLIDPDGQTFLAKVGETIVAAGALKGTEVAELKRAVTLSATNRLTVLPVGKAGAKVVVWVLGGTAVMDDKGGTVTAPFSGASITFPAASMAGQLLVQLTDVPLQPARYAPWSSTSHQLTITIY